MERAKKKYREKWEVTTKEQIVQTPSSAIFSLKYQSHFFSSPPTHSLPSKHNHRQYWHIANGELCEVDSNGQDHMVWELPSLLQRAPGSLEGCSHNKVSCNLRCTVSVSCGDRLLLESSTGRWRRGGISFKGGRLVCGSN